MGGMQREGRLGRKVDRTMIFVLVLVCLFTCLAFAFFVFFFAFLRN